ncbi:hypothetical protein ABT234_13775 [Streptomyces sp. NPDC001586]|uniref:hypothetical protein n=1 Tax=Streptomyces sp. NPDC001586 TaxID=3154387 RepID=UPI0033317F23
MTAPDWVQPVLTGTFLVLAYRVVRTSGAGLRSAVAFMVVLNVGLLWTMWDDGPPWAVPAVIAVSLVAAVVNTVAAARTALERVERVDTARFRDLVEHVAGSDGPQVLGVCVTYTGALVLTAFGSDARPEGRQFHLPPGPDCPFCLVEDQIRGLLGAVDPLLGEYRRHLRAGSSRHLLVRRSSTEQPWTGRLRDRAYYRVPRRRPSCPVHDPLLGTP